MIDFMDQRSDLLAKNVWYPEWKVFSCHRDVQTHCSKEGSTWLQS
jgi:hypothetical protein